MVLIGGDDLFHEQQLTGQIQGDKQHSHQVIDIGFDILLRLILLLRIFIQLISHEPILSRNGEIPHSEMQQLPHG